MESVACDPDGHASPRGTRVPRETGMLPSLLKPLGAVCGSHYLGHGYRREGGKRRRGEGSGGAGKETERQGSQGRKEGEKLRGMGGEVGGREGAGREGARPLSSACRCCL